MNLQIQSTSTAFTIVLFFVIILICCSHVCVSYTNSWLLLQQQSTSLLLARIGRECGVGTSTTTCYNSCKHQQWKYPYYYRQQQQQELVSSKDTKDTITPCSGHGITNTESRVHADVQVSVGMDNNPQRIIHNNTSLFSHSDIVWKLCPSSTDVPFVSILDVLKWRFQKTIISIYVNRKSKSKSNEVVDEDDVDVSPILVCPPGGQAILEAYEKSTNSFMGRFGITTQPGPFIPIIQETVQSLFPTTLYDDATGDDNDIDIDIDGNDKGTINVAAIKFMFVEEEYRGRNIGTLALEVISYIHAVQGCDYTMLVADDKTTAITTKATKATKATTTTIPNERDDVGNDIHWKQNQQQKYGKLVSWYERVGCYKVAPLLQDLVGSPGGKYGIAMIAPTLAKLKRKQQQQLQLPKDCTIIVG